MERNCIKCGKSIKPVWEKFNFPVNQEAWGGGVVNEITAGYGSNFDGNTFIIAICDKCIEDNLQILEVPEDYEDFSDGCFPSFI